MLRVMTRIKLYFIIFIQFKNMNIKVNKFFILGIILLFTMAFAGDYILTQSETETIKIEQELAKTPDYGLKIAKQAYKPDVRPAPQPRPVYNWKDELNEFGELIYDHNSIYDSMHLVIENLHFNVSTSSDKKYHNNRYKFSRSHKSVVLINVEDNEAGIRCMKKAYNDVISYWYNKYKLSGLTEDNIHRIISDNDTEFTYSLDFEENVPYGLYRTLRFNDIDIDDALSDKEKRAIMFVLCHELKDIIYVGLDEEYMGDPTKLESLRRLLQKIQ